MGLDISTRNHSFRAGSYSGFNSFREWLAEKVGYDSYAELLEKTEKKAGDWIDNRGQNIRASKAVKAGALFHHSDCDGYILDKDAKLLLGDLEHIKASLPPPPDINDTSEDAAQERWYREKLDDWIIACEDSRTSETPIYFT